MNRLIPVNINNNALKNKTNDFTIPLIFVNFNKTKVITVTEIAKTVRNPVFIPKIKKIEDVSSTGPFADKFVKSIFSGDAKRGTLKTAFIKNNTNSEMDTVFRWFCKRGNLVKIARPKMIPCNIPITNAPNTAIIEKIGSWNISTKNGINAIR